MDRLPKELYRLIVGFITDRRTIRALLFVSHIFKFEAERSLYRKMSPQGRYMQLKLFGLLSTSERIAKLVVELFVALDVSELNKVDDPSYWPPFALALRALVNLKSLTILVARMRYPMAHILDGCQFQLEAFSCTFPPGGNLFRFLENQPQIRRLSLDYGFSQNQLSPNALPQLSILTGPVNVINSLLPGRKITHLFWDPDSLGTEPDLPRIGPALNNIRVLKYGGLYTAPPPLRNIINYLGNLEVLQWSKSNHQQIIDNAPMLSRLQKIIFPWTRQSDSPEFIEKLFTSIQTLQVVDAWLGPNSGRRWSRGSGVPVSIFMAHDDWIFC